MYRDYSTCMHVLKVSAAKHGVRMEEKTTAKEKLDGVQCSEEKAGSKGEGYAKGESAVRSTAGAAAADVDAEDEELAAWGVQWAATKSVSMSAEGKDDSCDDLRASRESMSTLARACDFYYNSSELEDALQQWAFEHCEGFAEQEGEDGDGEYALEHTELHAQFVELLESRLEAFVRDELGMTVAEFFAEVAEDHDEAAARSAFSGSTFARLINAAIDFNRFFEMMCDAKLGCFAWGSKCCVPLIHNAQLQLQLKLQHQQVPRTASSLTPILRRVFLTQCPLSRTVKQANSSSSKFIPIACTGVTRHKKLILILIHDSRLHTYDRAQT